MARWLMVSLKRPSIFSRVIIKGNCVNGGAGYGLEVPCEHHSEGDNFSCNWLKENLVKDQFDVQC